MRRRLAPRLAPAACSDWGTGMLDTAGTAGTERLGVPPVERLSTCRTAVPAVIDQVDSVRPPPAPGAAGTGFA